MADSLLYNKPKNAAKNRLEVLKAYGKHADWEERHGDPIKIRRFLTKAVMTLFTGDGDSFVSLESINPVQEMYTYQGRFVI